MALTDSIKNLAEKLDPIYEKINGGLIGVIATIVGVITILVASLLFYSVEPFTFYTHWISNLGGVVTNGGQFPNGSNIVFAIGLITVGILAIPFMLYVAKVLLDGEQKYSILVVIFVLFGIFTLLGIIGVSLFDMKSQPILHVVFAAFFFLGSFLMVFFYGISLFFNSEISWIHGVFCLAVATVSAIFLLTLVPHIAQGGDIAALIISTGPELYVSRFWEWMFLFSIFSWLFETAVLMQKQD
jgi:hypothetical protein